MKFGVFSMLSLLVTAGVAPFVLPLKDGKPLLEFQAPDLKMPPIPELPELPNLSETTGGESEPNRQVSFYQWKDSNGLTQITSTPPPTGEYRTIKVNPNANMIQALPTAAAEEAEEKPKESKIPKPSLIPNPTSVKETINQAKNVEGLVKQREAAQAQALGSVR